MGLGLRWLHLLGAALFVGLYAVPVLGVAVHGMTVVRSIGTGAGAPGDPRPGFLLLEALFAVALLLAVPGLALAVHRDATRVAGSEWTPNARRYALLALAYPLSVLVVARYLRRRYRRVGVGALPAAAPLSRGRLTGTRWWYAVAAGPALLAAGLAAFSLPAGAPLTFAGALYVRVVAGLLLAGAGVALFAVGLTADAALVRASVVDWHPPTGWYRTPVTLVPALLPVAAAVYLFERHRHVGVP